MAAAVGKKNSFRRKKEENFENKLTKKVFMYQFLMAKKLLMNIVPLKWKLKKKEFKNKFQQN